MTQKNLIKQAIEKLTNLSELVLCYSGDRSIESTVSSIVRDCTDILVKYDYAKIFEEDRPRLRSLLDLRGRLTQAGEVVLIF